MKKTIGCFENVLPILSRLQSEQSLYDLIKQIDESLKFAQDRSDVPFEHIVEALNPHRELNTNPIFQSGLALNRDTSGIPF